METTTRAGAGNTGRGLHRNPWEKTMQFNGTRMLAGQGSWPTCFDVSVSTIYRAIEAGQLASLKDRVGARAPSGFRRTGGGSLRRPSAAGTPGHRSSRRTITRRGAPVRAVRHMRRAGIEDGAGLGCVSNSGWVCGCRAPPARTRRCRGYWPLLVLAGVCGRVACAGRTRPGRRRSASGGPGEVGWARSGDVGGRPPGWCGGRRARAERLAERFRGGTRGWPSGWSGVAPGRRAGRCCARRVVLASESAVGGCSAAPLGGHSAGSGGPVVFWAGCGPRCGRTWTLRVGGPRDGVSPLSWGPDFGCAGGGESRPSTRTDLYKTCGVWGRRGVLAGRERAWSRV